MLDQIRPYLAVNAHNIDTDYGQRQKHISDLNEAIPKYEEQVGKDQTAHAKESWYQWAKRTAGSPMSYVTHSFGQKGPDLRRRDFGWTTGTMIDTYTAT